MPSSPDKNATYCRRYYQTHTESVSVSRAQYKAAHPEMVKQSNARWAEQHPEERRFLRRMSMRVARAIRAGKLVRPESCSRCGRGGRIEAAHHDYSKPLEVVWLCVKCHRLWDAKEPKMTGELS